MPVLGMEKLRAAFLALPKEIATKALDKAVAQAIEPIRAAAQGLAPKRTGALAASIVSAKDKNPQRAGLDVRYYVYPKFAGRPGAAVNEKGKSYFQYVEMGSSKMAAKPFLRPAFVAQYPQSIQIIYQSLADSVPRIANSLSK